MNIEYVKGNLIDLAEEGMFDAVCHGANCFHTMGSGIAPKLNEMTGWHLLKADEQTPYGDINKLGKVSMTYHKPKHAPNKVVGVYNIYTQYVHAGHIGSGNVVMVNWEAFEKGLEYVLRFSGPNPHVGIPLIGCGLAGGSRLDFELVLTRIQDKFDQGTITVVEFDG